MIKSGFSYIKRKYGGVVRARNGQGPKVEIYCKDIAHNLELWTGRLSAEPIIFLGRIGKKAYQY